MNIVFIGSSHFGHRCLEACLGLQDLQVTGILSSPQKFSISYQPSGVTNVLHADFFGIAKKHGIPLHMLEQSMNEDGLYEAIVKCKPDMFLVAGWYHMIPKRWRKLAPAFGLHASLLPDYSGGAPLVWAMINGEKTTGITFFKLAGGVDEGPIVGQKATNILPDDTIATLYKRIEDLGVELLVEHLPLLANKTAILTDQDESQRRLVPQRAPKDGKIKWQQPAPQIYDFIRAQTHPYPGAFSHFRQSQINIWQSALLENDSDKNLQPGEIIILDNRLIVGCADHTCLELIQLSENNVETRAIEWAQSKTLEKGECFES